MKASELLELIAHVLLITSEKEALQADRIGFKDGKMWAFNGTIAFSSKAPFKVPDNTAIPASALLNFLKAAKNKEVTLDFSKENCCRVLIKNGQLQIVTDAWKMPIDDIVSTSNAKTWQKLDPGFGAALNMAASFCTRNTFNQGFSCVYGNDGFLFGCDNIKAVQIQSGLSKKVKFLLLAQTAQIISGIDPLEIACDTESDWIHFRNKTLTASCRLSDLEYPNICSFFNGKGDKIQLPKNLGHIFERAASICKETATVMVDNDVLTVRAKGDFAKFAERTESSGIPSMTFTVVPKAAAELLMNSYIAQLIKNGLLLASNNIKMMLSIIMEK